MNKLMNFSTEHRPARRRHSLFIDHLHRSRRQDRRSFRPSSAPSNCFSNTSTDSITEYLKPAIPLRRRTPHLQGKSVNNPPWTLDFHFDAKCSTAPTSNRVRVTFPSFSRGKRLGLDQENAGIQWCSDRPCSAPLVLSSQHMHPSALDEALAERKKMFLGRPRTSPAKIMSGTGKPTHRSIKTERSKSALLCKMTQPNKSKVGDQPCSAPAANVSKVASSSSSSSPSFSRCAVARTDLENVKRAFPSLHNISRCSIWTKTLENGPSINLNPLVMQRLGFDKAERIAIWVEEQEALLLKPSSKPIELSNMKKHQQQPLLLRARFSF